MIRNTIKSLIKHKNSEINSEEKKKKEIILMRTCIFIFNGNYSEAGSLTTLLNSNLGLNNKLIL